jgi:hypothetical protein
MTDGLGRLLLEAAPPKADLPVLGALRSRVSRGSGNYRPYFIGQGRR